MHSTLTYNRRFEQPQQGVANSLHTRACQRGQRQQFWASLTGRSRALFSLEEVRKTCRFEAQSDGGIRFVAIDQIRGSENRCADFDCDFSPLQSHTQGRWLSIFQARQDGKVLPPVSLVQVGDLYFVRDGHHRISVAQALGQKAVEARVSVWQVAGLLPWEQTSQAPGSLPGRSRPASILGRLLGNLPSTCYAAAPREAA